MLDFVGLLWGTMIVNNYCHSTMALPGKSMCQHPVFIGSWLYPQAKYSKALLIKLKKAAAQNQQKKKIRKHWCEEESPSSTIEFGHWIDALVEDIDKKQEGLSPIGLHLSLERGDDGLAASLEEKSSSTGGKVSWVKMAAKTKLEDLKSQISGLEDEEQFWRAKALVLEQAGKTGGAFNFTTWCSVKKGHWIGQLCIAAKSALAALIEPLLNWMGAGSFNNSSRVKNAWQSQPAVGRSSFWSLLGVWK